MWLIRQADPQSITTKRFPYQETPRINFHKSPSNSNKQSNKIFQLPPNWGPLRCFNWSPTSSIEARFLQRGRWSLRCALTPGHTSRGTDNRCIHPPGVPHGTILDNFITRHIVHFSACSSFKVRDRFVQKLRGICVRWSRLREPIAKRFIDDTVYNKKNTFNLHLVVLSTDHDFG